MVVAVPVPKEFEANSTEVKKAIEAALKEAKLVIVIFSCLIIFFKAEKCLWTRRDPFST